MFIEIEPILTFAFLIYVIWKSPAVNFASCMGMVKSFSQMKLKLAQIIFLSRFCSYVVCTIMLNGDLFRPLINRLKIKTRSCERRNI